MWEPDVYPDGWVLPADAGMSRGASVDTCNVTGAPRRRGDEPKCVMSLSPGVMCSPQTRG